LLLNRHKNICNDFFVFYKFQLPSFLLLPCHCSGVPVNDVGYTVNDVGYTVNDVGYTVVTKYFNIRKDDNKKARV